jgi:hypothetical protein
MTGHTNDKGTGTSLTVGAQDTVKLPRFSGTLSWTVVHRHFEVLVVQNNLTAWEKAMHLIAVLQGQAADILHIVPEGAVYKDIVEVFSNHYGDHQLVDA